MTIRIGLPQAIWLLLVVWGLVDATINHGKPRTPHNAPLCLAATILGALLLWWGGFFGGVA